MSFAVALILIIIALPYLLLLRAILAVRIGGSHLTSITLREPPPAWGDLFSADAVVFQAAGFVGPFWFAVGRGAQQTRDPQPESGEVQAVAIWIHPSGIFAQHRAPADQNTPHTTVITLISESMTESGGIIVETQRNEFSAKVQSCVGYQVQQISTHSLEAMLSFHQSRTASMSLRPFSAEQTSAGELYREFEARHVQQLQAENKVKAYPNGRVYLSWSSGLRAVLAYIAREKLPAVTAPIPPARFVHFSELTKRVASSAPPSDRQWTLFLVSVFASIVAGAWILGWAFSLQLLLVILIHELGHFIAMRAFGYKNMQMLALPLVGGVAMGFEETPNANHRAWMALAGPLPGIAIGVALYVVSAFHNLPIWWSDCANIFLLVNLLNLLPFPPLDGSKVLDALLPKQHLVWSAWITLLGALVGVAVAWYADFTILALLIGLHLLATPVLFARAKAATQVRRKGLPAKRLAASLRLQGVFESIDQTLGTTHEVPLRGALGAAILESDTIVPMRWPSRLFIGGLFFGTLAIPLAAFVSIMTLTADFAPQPEKIAEMQRLAEAANARESSFKAQSLKLSLAELHRELKPPQNIDLSAATDAEIRATETRLDTTFSKDLLALYQLGDGFSEFGIAPLSELQWQQPEVEENDEYDEAYDEEGEAIQSSEKASPANTLRFTRSERGQQLSLSANAKLLALADGVMWYDLETPPRNPRIRIYTIDGFAYEDFREYFAERWVAAKSAAASTLLRRVSLQDRAKQWLEKSDEEMLEALQNPLPWYFFANNEKSRPAGASAAELHELTARVGEPLQDEHAALLILQNGDFLGFKSAQKVVSANTIVNQEMFLGPVLCLPGERCPKLSVTSELLKSCWMIAGIGNEQPHARLIWCPKLSETPYIDAQHFRYPSARHYLAELAATVSPK